MSFISFPPEKITLKRSFVSSQASAVPVFFSVSSKPGSCADHGECKSQMWVPMDYSEIANLQFAVSSETSSIFRDKHSVKHWCHLKTQIPPGVAEKPFPHISWRQSVPESNLFLWRVKSQLEQGSPLWESKISHPNFICLAYYKAVIRRNCRLLQSQEWLWKVVLSEKKCSSICISKTNKKQPEAMSLLGRRDPSTGLIPGLPHYHCYLGNFIYPQDNSGSWALTPCILPLCLRQLSSPMAQYPNPLGSTEGGMSHPAPPGF